MKKAFFVVFCGIIFCFSNAIHAMERVQIDEYQPIPQDLIINLAVYCEPHAKNLLMKVCKFFNTQLKARDVIIQANPDTVSIHDKRQALFESIKNSNENMVRILLATKLDPNCPDILNVVPLHYAIEKNNTVIMQLLIRHGADTTINRPIVLTLHNAVHKGNKDIVHRLLKDKKIDVNQQCRYGFSALHIASQQGNTDVVKLLLINDADVNIASKAGITPLYIATKKGHVDIVDLLIEKNAHVNQVDQKGNTLLHIATRGGHVAVVERLLEAGARIHQANEQGETPLYIASSCGQAEIVKLLLRKRAQVHLETEDGDTSLDAALENNYAEIVALLLDQDEPIKEHYQPAKGILNFLYCTMSSIGI